MNVIHYSDYTGLDPICAERIRQYPELAAVRDATPDERQHIDRGDLEDAQHQWAYPGRTHVMQSCFEDGCDAQRPIPLHGYSDRDQAFILQTFIRNQLSDAHASSRTAGGTA